MYSVAYKGMEYDCDQIRTGFNIHLKYELGIILRQMKFNSKNTYCICLNNSTFDYKYMLR